jgi:hypothetical protein
MPAMGFNKRGMDSERAAAAHSQTWSSYTEDFGDERGIGHHMRRGAILVQIGRSGEI